MNAYLFDVDGVLTDIKNRVVDKEELIAQIISKLQNGEPVGFITGRGLDWLSENAINALEAYINDKNLDVKLLNNLYVSGEFGGVSMMHVNGERKIIVDENFAIPKNLREKLIEKIREYKDVVYPETEKQTMVSAPSYPETAERLFNEKKHEIIESLKKIIEGHNEFEVHSDRYAINVKNKKADKHHATSLFIDWLKVKQFMPDKYFAFGDSISDLEIGQELYDRGLDMEFIFVGKAEELEGKNIQFPYIVTQADFDAGTLEYLTK